ncbi:MAG: hypothetical protein R6V47_05145 [Candidatus Delongbacteria bacterium]
MKKNTIILTVLIMLFALNAQVEKVAIEVLKAYKNQDVELLKKNASGILKPAINKNYFADKAIKKDMKALESWDGKIKEIRYDSENVMGNPVVVAVAHYSDNSDEELNAVMLTTMDKKEWVFLGTGLEQISTDNFKKMSTSIPEPAKNGAKEAKAEKSSRSKAKMDIELASGDQFTNVNETKLVESFDSMDDDNFFMILSDGDDFVQAAYSDGNYIIEYSLGGVQYEAGEILPKKTALNVFKKYLLGETDWREGVKWVKK